MDEIGSKLLIAFAIFLVSFLSAAAPSKVIKIDDQIFSCGNLLASGVLLSGSLVHQLPDSIENLKSIAADFPLATFVAGLIFCLFLILEEYLHSRFDDNMFEEGHNHSDHYVSFQHSSLPLRKEGENEYEERIENRENDNLEIEIKRHVTAEPELEQKQKQSRISLFGLPISQHKPCQYRRSSFKLVASHKGKRQTDSDRVLPNEATALFLRNSTGQGVLAIRKSVRPSVFNTWRRESFDTIHPVHHHDDHLAEHMHGSLLASIILLLALSIHSIFEGLAIGVSPDMSEVMSTAAAVLAHKGFAGYALGSSMIASQMDDNHFIVLVLIFAFCSILGIFLGMLFEQFSTGGNAATVTGIIQAMVGGTFLYVSIVEIGMKEIMMYRHSETSKNDLSPKAMDLWKLVAFLTGYILMSMLAIWV
jgi:zinc transporter ZupT